MRLGPTRDCVFHRPLIPGSRASGSAMLFTMLTPRQHLCPRGCRTAQRQSTRVSRCRHMPAGLACLGSEQRSERGANVNVAAPMQISWPRGSQRPYIVEIRNRIHEALRFVTTACRWPSLVLSPLSLLTRTRGVFRSAYEFLSQSECDRVYRRVLLYMLNKTGPRNMVRNKKSASENMTAMPCSAFSN